MGNLTMARVKAIKAPGLHGDGGTLYLRVAPGGSKSWIQRLTINGRRRDVGLGGWPLVTLAEAREFAFENRRLARRGGDPLADRHRPNRPTFEQAAVQTFEANRPVGATRRPRPTGPARWLPRDGGLGCPDRGQDAE